MIQLKDCTGKTYIVLGYGKTGQSGARALHAAGARVHVWDDKPATRATIASDGFIALSDANIAWHTIDGLLISPGVPAQHPLIAAAKSARCPLTNDVDLLFSRFPAGRYVGITGTNGKSTTTALINHIFAATGQQPIMAGNIGLPILDAPMPSGESPLFVLELSSYQLELAQAIHVNTAIFLNITADHLERHGTMEAYIAAKKRIFMNQQAGDAAIIGVDSSLMRKLYDEIAATSKASVIPISVMQKLKYGAYCQDGQLIDALGKKPEVVADMARFDKLVGIHNWQNCLAAYVAARQQGLASAAILDAMATFPGLAHRQEVIAVHRGVRYINDSKATNADATARALSCYDPIYWILGGQPKKGGIDMLAPYYPRIAHAYCIGEAAKAFSIILTKANVPNTIVETLDKAVAAAHQRAQHEGKPNAVVLLSPACASFDQFNNFEHRGDVFRQEVAAVLAAAQGSHAAGVL